MAVTVHGGRSAPATAGSGDEVGRRVRRRHRAWTAGVTEVLALQSDAGNQAVAAAIQRSRLCVQRTPGKGPASSESDAAQIRSELEVFQRLAASIGSGNPGRPGFLQKLSAAQTSVAALQTAATALDAVDKRAPAPDGSGPAVARREAPEDEAAGPEASALAATAALAEAAVDCLERESDGAALQEATASRDRLAAAAVR